jgi:hypothetical protein
LSFSELYDVPTSRIYLFPKYIAILVEKMKNNKEIKKLNIYPQCEQLYFSLIMVYINIIKKIKKDNIAIKINENRSN